MCMFQKYDFRDKYYCYVVGKLDLVIYNALDIFTYKKTTEKFGEEILKQ